MSEIEKEKVIVYSSYTPAQKKATTKYRTENKEKVNEQRKKYYKERVEKDPNFLDYKRDKAKEYYSRKKTNNKSEEIPISIPTTEDKKEEQEKSDTIIHPETQPVIEIPKIKLTRKKQTNGPILDEEQKKTIKTLSKLLKENIIDTTKYQESKWLVTEKKPLLLTWLDKKGKLKSLDYLTECTAKPVIQCVIESEPDVPTDIDSEIKEDIKQAVKEDKIKKTRTRKPKPDSIKKE